MQKTNPTIRLRKLMKMLILEAHKCFEKLGATVLSPRINEHGELGDITPDSEHEHLKAIRECDMVFIANKDEDGYIGETTKCEIYFAHALYKPIALWHKPPKESQMSFIPWEIWEDIL